MSFNLSVRVIHNYSLELNVKNGEVLFLLGMNGSGKSSLMHRLFVSNASNAKRITAHRQTWFETNAISLSAHQKSQIEISARQYDTNRESRWADQYPGQRSGIAIFDLTDAENVRARRIAAACDDDNIELAKKLRLQAAPIKIINELLSQSNIPVSIYVHENSQIFAKKSYGTPYSIAELSDGERNAILIAADILTAKPGTLLLIDEPERHLHRSIISPLLTQLFTKREDCTFVISTHDVSLPLDNQEARVLLVRGCRYNYDGQVLAWDADLVSTTSQIDEEIKRDILGGRRKILFVEGTDTSLDKALYSLLFPNVSVIPKGSCRDVEHTVKSIRAATDFHWLDVFGLVDNDSRAATELDQLKQYRIYATPTLSVEALYYHPEIQRRVAERHAITTGSDAGTCLAKAASAALASVSTHAERLSERVAEKMVRDEFISHMPNRSQLGAAPRINVSIDVQAILATARARLQSAIDRSDLNEVILRYPVRETPALTEIARHLGFQNRGQYESAVRKLLMDDSSALAFARSLFEPLTSEIGANSLSP